MPYSYLINYNLRPTPETSLLISGSEELAHAAPQHF
jgi:hypothetical protein